ncbi:MAG TPA: GGDEF domain-containing protein, partial [Achromobacter sp.]|nr:GGDEF domain-containing protein [Achromobacter sp.]
MPATLLEWSVPAAILLCAIGLCAARFVGFNTLRWGYALGCLGTGYAIMLVQASELSPYKQVVEDAFILGGVMLACRA